MLTRSAAASGGSASSSAASASTSSRAPPAPPAISGGLSPPSLVPALLFTPLSLLLLKMFPMLQSPHQLSLNAHQLFQFLLPAVLPLPNTLLLQVSRSVLLLEQLPAGITPSQFILAGAIEDLPSQQYGTPRLMPVDTGFCFLRLRRGFCLHG
jgi:hypothetical protein